MIEILREQISFKGILNILDELNLTSIQRSAHQEKIEMIFSEITYQLDEFKKGKNKVKELRQNLNEFRGVSKKDKKSLEKTEEMKQDWLISYINVWI